MARIPEAQRRIFNQTIVGPNLGAIGAAQAGFTGIAQGANQIVETLGRQREQELTAQGAEFGSRLTLQFQEQFSNVVKRPDIQKDPKLASMEVNRIADTLMGSDEFRNQPQAVQNLGRRRLSQLKQSFGAKALIFQNDQSFQNTIGALNQTQNNFELQALTSDTSINDLLKGYTAAVTASTASGALTLNQGEEQVLEGAKSITLNRAQRLINEGDLEAAQAFIQDKEIQEHLGADGVQRVQDTIERKQRLRLAQKAKANEQRFTNPWKFVEQADTERAPAISLNPQTLSDDIDNRMEYIARKNQQFGLDLPLFNDSEKKLFISTLDKANPEQAAALLNQITSSLPNNQQNLIAGQIFEDRPTLGVAVAVADDDPLLAESLLSGQRIIKQKLIKMPKESEIKGFVNEQIVPVISDGQQQLLASIQQAVLSIYADEILKANDNTGVTQSSIVEDALEKLVGPVIEINDVETLGFRKANGQFIDEDQFQDFFDDITEEQLNASLNDVPRDIKGNPIPLSEVKDQGELVLVGQGQYVIRLFDELAVDKNGAPYILDLRKMFIDSPPESEISITPGFLRTITP